MQRGGNALLIAYMQQILVCNFCKSVSFLNRFNTLFYTRTETDELPQYSSLLIIFQILGVLSQDGVARFVDINSCQVLFELRSPEDSDKLTSICLSSEGSDFIVGTSEAGRFVVYNIKLLCPDFHKVCTV